jgi:hypothetical protein
MSILLSFLVPSLPQSHVLFLLLSHFSASIPLSLMCAWDGAWACAPGDTGCGRHGCPVFLFFPFSCLCLRFGVGDNAEGMRLWGRDVQVCLRCETLRVGQNGGCWWGNVPSLCVMLLHKMDYGDAQVISLRCLSSFRLGI